MKYWGGEYWDYEVLGCWGTQGLGAECCLDDPGWHSVNQETRSQTDDDVNLFTATTTGSCARRNPNTIDSSFRANISYCKQQRPEVT